MLRVITKHTLYSNNFFSVISFLKQSFCLKTMFTCEISRNMLDDIPTTNTTNNRPGMYWRELSIVFGSS